MRIATKPASVSWLNASDLLGRHATELDSRARRKVEGVELLLDRGGCRPDVVAARRHRHGRAAHTLDGRDAGRRRRPRRRVATSAIVTPGKSVKSRIAWIVVGAFELRM